MTLSISIIALVLVALVGLAARLQGDGAVYSAQEVQTGLQHYPRDWLGRTIRVHGVIVGYTTSTAGPSSYFLAQPDLGSGWSGSLSDPSSVAGPFVFETGATEPNTLLTWLRRVPILDRVVPGERAGGAQDSTYQVKIVDASADPACSTRPCY